MKSMQRMERMQQVQPPQSLQGRAHPERTARRWGLSLGAISGIIDAIYFTFLSHTHFSLRTGVLPYLWPSADAPYFNVFWTFLYSIPTYILLLLVFLLAGFLTTYTTRILTKHVTATVWTGIVYLVLHCLLGVYGVFSSEIYGQLGSNSTPEVEKAVLIPALLYSVVAGAILTLLGLGLSRLGGLLARALFSRTESSRESREENRVRASSER